VIAGLFQICSGGVADYTWRTLGYPEDMDLIDIGEQRFQRENTPFSYQNCLVAELDGRLAGMAHAYVMPEADIRPHAVFPPQFKRARWWQWPGTASLILTEYIKYLAARARHAADRLTGGV